MLGTFAILTGSCLLTKYSEMSLLSLFPHLNPEPTTAKSLWRVRDPTVGAQISFAQSSGHLRSRAFNELGFLPIAPFVHGSGNEFPVSRFIDNDFQQYVLLNSRRTLLSTRARKLSEVGGNRERKSHRPGQGAT